jgi:Effector Associated Constant Component 1
VYLRVDGESPDSVRSLRAWLEADRAVREHGDLRWPYAGTHEHQGVLIDVLQLAVGGGLSAVQLVVAIAQWRDSRHPKPVVTITRELADGTSIRIETSDPAVLERVVRELEDS